MSGPKSHCPKNQFGIAAGAFSIHIVRGALRQSLTIPKDLYFVIIDIYPNPVINAIVDVSYKNIYRLIGKTIDRDLIKKILQSLDILILNEDGDDLKLEIPAYRVDVKCDADVIEEILRIYGYNNIAITEHVNSTITYSEKPDKEKVLNIVADLLSANGFSEIMCNSLNPSAWYEQNSDFDKKQLVILANPQLQDGVF